MLEPDAWKRACPVLRGEGHGNVVLLPDHSTSDIVDTLMGTRPTSHGLKGVRKLLGADNGF